MWELRYELIFISAFYLLQNVYEFVIPYCRMGKVMMNKFNENTIKGKSQESILKKKVYTEWHKSSYDDGEINGVVEEYLEIVMQFGYVYLFSIAFALIPLVGVLNNIAEMYIDRSKLLYLTRRPIQQSVKSHGIYTYLIEVLAFIGIFTNFAIMSFTANAFGSKNRADSFIWTCVCIFVIRFIIQEMIPNEPEVIFDIKQRHKLIIERTLGKHGREVGDKDDIFEQLDGMFLRISAYVIL